MDAAGADPTPATRTFTVETGGPVPAAPAWTPLLAADCVPAGGRMAFEISDPEARLRVSSTDVGLLPTSRIEVVRRGGRVVLVLAPSRGARAPRGSP